MVKVSFDFKSNVGITLLTVVLVLAGGSKAQPTPSGNDPNIVLSGLRIEPKEPRLDNPFVGYQVNTSIVQPDNEVRVVIFGHNLNKVHSVAFVSAVPGAVNCSQASPELKRTEESSWIWLNSRITLVLKFPKALEEQYFHLCYAQHDSEEWFHVNNPYLTITTHVPPKEYYFNFYVELLIVLFLLALSGLFSGLNLGLMSLSPQELQLVINSGSEDEQKFAKTILPVRQNGNFLLCTLLIGNVIVNSAISILMDDLTGSGYIALVSSSAFIVVVGEIIPQSICVKKGLAVGAYTIFITKAFMILTWPLAYPISKILNLILGEEIQSYDRKRLLELIKMNQNGEAQEELKIAIGAIEFSGKTASDVMTRIDDVFMLPDNTILDLKTINEIMRHGYTRIPIHSACDRNKVVSLLLVKDLVLVDPDNKFNVLTICNYHRHPVRFVMEDTPLKYMLNEFKKGESHLAMVHRLNNENEDRDPTYELIGVVTLEDIVEEILQEEIVDETDAFMDNINRTRRKGNQTRCAPYVEPDKSYVIPVRMQHCTLQFLSTNIKAFDEHLISKGQLERFIRFQCRRVDLTHLMEALGGQLTEIPKGAKFYTKGEYSERLILILEGRAMVTIGQNAMEFEAGSWYSFGDEMLDKLIERLETESLPNNEKNLSKSSLTFSNDHQLGFYPDYSVVVKDTCTYLEVTASQWLNAYKKTQLGLGAPRQSLTPMGGRSHSHHSLDERKQLIIHPQVDAIRNGKNRSASESEHMELLPRNVSPLSDRSVLSQV